MAATDPPVPPTSAEERAALLDFIRQAKFSYGPWKRFKAAYKYFEASALDFAARPDADVEILSAFAARLDAAALTNSATGQRPLRLMAPDEASPFASNAITKTATGNGVTFTVEGSSNYYASGWILSIRPDPTAVASPLGRVMSGLRNIAAANAAPPTDATPPTETRLRSDSYFYGLQAVSWKNDVLSIRGSYGTAQQVDVSDLSFPHFVGAGPSADTMAYMKRRVRRLGRKLASKRPDLYVELTVTLWRALGDKAINPALNWAAMDSLFARSPRWQMVDVGLYTRRAGWNFVRRRREERAPEVWDARPGLMRELYLDMAVPPAVNDLARKVLVANAQPLPALDAQRGRRFLHGPIATLQAEGVRSLAAAWLGGEHMNGSTIADVILAAPGPLRRRLLDRVQVLAADARSDWNKHFVTRLSAVLDLKQYQSFVYANGVRSLVTRPSKRRRVAGQVLVTLFADAVSDATIWANIEFFLGLGGRAREMTLAKVLEAARRGDLLKLDILSAIAEPGRTVAVDVFLSGAPASKPGLEDTWKLVSKFDAAQNAVGWRFLASTAIEGEVLRALWGRVIAGHTGVYGPTRNARETAFSDASALELWRRADFTGEEVRKMLSDNVVSTGPLFATFSADFFAAVADTLPPDEVPAFVFAGLSSLQPDVGAAVFRRYQHLAANYEPQASELLADARPVGWWQFLSASRVSPEVLRGVWQNLFTYFGPEAVALFRRAQPPGDEIAAWLAANPALRAQFSPKFFAAVFEFAAPSAKIELALQADAASWDAVRSLLLRFLADDAGRAAFWRAVFDHPSVQNASQVLASDGAASAPTLQDRILSDEAILSTLEQISAQSFADFLASANPNHEPFLLRWLRANIGSQERSSVALIAAATHPLADVRDLGLARVRELGLNVPLALRLMESNLPQPFEVGREYFESVPRGSDDERDFALALCDSPNKLVREFGRAFVQERSELLEQSSFLRALSEHSDPAMQAFVAEYLLRREASAEKLDTSSFDAPVLRSRGRSRRAKEVVKKRLQDVPASEAIGAEEAEALVDVARGTTARDREWALQQIARRALAGQAMDGVTVREKGE